METFTTGKSTSGFWLMPRPLKTSPNPVKHRVPKPMRAIISIHAKTWLRMEMSARVIPVAIFLTSSFLLVLSSSRSAPAWRGCLGRRRGHHACDVDAVREAVGALDHHRLLRLHSGQDLDDPVPVRSPILIGRSRALPSSTT